MGEEFQKSAGKMIGSIQKAAQVLEILVAAPGGLGATEISQKMNSGVSGTYHILNTMKACRLIDQDAASKKYRIGFGLYRLCMLSGAENIFWRIARPYLDHLSETCGETSNLILLDGLEIVYAAQSSQPNQTQMFTQLGSRAPYYCTGAGKVMLAFRDPAEWQRYISNTNFRRFTNQTITSAPELVMELESIRRNGIAYDLEEREDGVLCVAVPVLDINGYSVAAISISGPSGRIREKLKTTDLKQYLNNAALGLQEELRR